MQSGPSAQNRLCFMIDLLAREDERNDVLRCLVKPKLDVRMDVSVRWQESRDISCLEYPGLDSRMGTAYPNVCL